MINELYGLTEALDHAKIATERTHAKYKLIPKVSKKVPCIHIIFDHGKIYQVESIEIEQAAKIRKYGSNQGTFPAMNLAPLYRLTDNSEKNMIDELLERKTTDFDIKEIRQLCRENNWGKKFTRKYRLCMEAVPHELTELFQKAGTEFTSFFQFAEEIKIFSDAAQLHIQLENAAMSMLEQKTDIILALQILFYLGKGEKNVEDDYGTLSVVLDSRRLIEDGLSVAADRFTFTLNRKLLEAEAAMKPKAEKQEIDAFGLVFDPVEEPMPTVKLAAGFEVSLRTMFRGQPCQSRYGRIENASYPISRELRFKLQSSLAWMSSAEHKNVTWINIDKDEALFAYRETVRENMTSMVDFFSHQVSEKDRDRAEARERIWNEKSFEKAVEAFICEFVKTKKPGTDPKSEHIQYFILKKLDKARTKVVFTCNTTPAELERRSEEWSLGCNNLPAFLFGQPKTLFPVEVSGILNQIWRLDGESASEKFKPIPAYYGIQMLFGEEQSTVRRGLFILMGDVENLLLYLGRERLPQKGYNEWPEQRLNQTKKILALIGLFLYELGIRKEKYMKEFPYLFGQLLKVSDALHEMYCRVVRGNDVPNVLAGIGLYCAGAEQPYKTLSILGYRMNPYIAWARNYRAKGILIKEEESWRAGWYLSMYERIASQLREVWGDQTRFNDEEKACYFIGYLAAFPKKENREENQNEGGKQNV